MDDFDNVFVPQVTVGVIPKAGQVFESHDDAYNFYKQYSREAGFSIRIHNCRKNKETKEVVWKLFVCSREGKTDESYREKLKMALSRNRGESRCGCTARMSVVKQKDENTWAVSQFIEQHNHPLTTPSKVHLLRSHREVSVAKKALTQQLSEANIPTCQQVRLMEIDAGGVSSMGCGEKDIRNYQRDLRKELLGHDAETLIEHFELEKERNPNFFYVYETDEDGVLCRCFWEDCESRSAYAHFGDAIVFDTTYNTNKYSMILAPFVGVNHHCQTVVFGCGLLSDEKTDSFTWLFSTFLSCMVGQSSPGLIITDQDAAIARAVAEIFPNTVHRFCIWHILNKFSEKLNAVLYRDQYHRLVNIIRDSETPNEFESRWKQVMDTTALGTNEWLQSMFEIRSRWVPSYVRHVFAAGMSSSQRVESTHAFFKRYVNKQNTLMDFITRFSRALASKRHQELVMNHIDLSEIPRVVTPSMMERQMTGIYTKAIFLLFQNELEQSFHYYIARKSSSESEKIYNVERVVDGQSFERHREVTYHVASEFISCSCKLFEFEGYPCRHMLALMKKKQVFLLPDIYIVRRWTKGVKSVHVFEEGGHLSHGQSLISRHGLLAYMASDLVDEGSLTEARSSFLVSEFRNLKVQVQSVDDGGDIGSSRNRSSSRDGTPVLCDPTPVRTKGCGKRLKSSKEKAIAHGTRNCRTCGRSGHDKRTCPTLQTRSHLVDEPYHPHFSSDRAQETGFMSIDSNTYNAWSETFDELP